MLSLGDLKKKNQLYSVKFPLSRPYVAPFQHMARAAQLCLCVIAAFVLWDYAQLNISRFLGRVHIAGRIPCYLGSDCTAECPPCPVRISQQQHMNVATAAAAAGSAAPAVTAATLPAAGLAPIRVQSGLDNPLFKFHNDLKTKEGPAMHKWDQYFDVYHRYFQRFVGKEVGAVKEKSNSNPLPEIDPSTLNQTLVHARCAMYV